MLLSYGCRRYHIIILFAVLILASCAQVPKESVELSTTVGRDIAKVHQSHRNLANALFGRMKQDVNRFVDNVYAPFQIQYVLSKQKEKQKAGDENNLFSVQEKATQNPNDAQAQKDLFFVMQAIVEAIHEDIEDYRQARLAPILQQEREVTASIDLIYDHIEQGNAVVTAHLASVVKVHEAQDELLQKVNLGGLQEKIGVKLSDTSERIANYVDKAKKAEVSIDDASKQMEKWTSDLDKVIKGD